MNWKNYFSRFFAIGILAMLVITSTGCNLFLSDEEVITKMMTSMLALDSYSTDMTIFGDVFPNDENSFGALEGSFLVNVKGDAMMSKKEEGIYSSAPASYNIDASLTAQGTTLAFNADFKTIDNVIYLKLNKLPMIPMMDLSEYLDQWVKLDMNKIMETFADIKTGEEEDLDPRVKELYDYFYELSQNSNIFIVKENLGKTKIDGHKVHHFMVDVDKDVVVSLIKSIVTKINNLTDDDSNDLKIEDFDEEFTKALEDIDLNNFELFIDTNDFYLRRIIMPIKVSPRTEELSIDFNFDMKYDNFNEITVESFEEPENVIDLMEMYNEEVSSQEFDSAFDEDFIDEMSDEELELMLKSLE